MKPLYLLVLFSLLASPVLLTAQIVARQGTPADSPLEEFKSPMVLDLPIKDFKDLAPDTGRDFKEVRKYYCDDVVLSQLMVTKRDDSHRGKPPAVKLDIRGAVSTRPSYDRLAILRFDVVKGEKRLATAQVSQIDAEEGRTRTFATSLRLEAEEFDRLFGEGEPPLLRVTVTVKDNN
jgi:hypothetical protein